MYVKLAAAAAVGILAYKEGIFTVEVGCKALIFNRLQGLQREVYAEGLHFKVPFRD